MSFIKDLQRFIAKTERRADAVVRKTAIDLNNKVMIRTPVDKGRARANWNVAVNTVDVRTFLEGYLSPAQKQSQNQTKIKQANAGDVINLSNNLPYIIVLEDGGYPDPVQDGTYIPKGKSRNGVAGPGYIQLSSGGYSKQAPNGMVKVTVQEFPMVIQNAVRTAKRRHP